MSGTTNKVKCISLLAFQQRILLPVLQEENAALECTEQCRMST